MPVWEWIGKGLLGLVLLVIILVVMFFVLVPVDRLAAGFRAKITFKYYNQPIKKKADKKAESSDTYADMAKDEHLPDKKSGRLIVYLPGILADGDTSSDPVRDTWLQYGDVLTVSYGTEHFNGRWTARTVAQRLLDDTEHTQFVFMGSSMGGMLAIDIINQLRRAKAIDKVKASTVILIDSPSGSRDMLGGGNIGAPVMRLLPFGRANNRLLAWAMQKMLKPPKDPNIESHLDKAEVKRQAMENMGKYRLSIWRDQLAYMAGHRPFKHKDFDDIARVIYLRCHLNNETVKQPQATLAWKESCHDLIDLPVKSTHCGYLERPLTWNEKFHEVMGRVPATTR